MPLMAAANVEMAKLLVSLGADVNFKYANGSVLESFIRKDAEAKNIFAYLLDAGADPNMVVDSMPVLMKTMDKTLGDFSNMLIAHGAETDLRSDSGASFARSFGVYSGNPSFTKTGRKNSPREQLLQSIAWGEYSFVEGILDAQLDKVKDLLNTALWQAAKGLRLRIGTYRMPIFIRTRSGCLLIKALTRKYLMSRAIRCFILRTTLISFHSLSRTASTPMP